MDKLTLYELLSVFVPGAILVGAVVVLVPQVGHELSAPVPNEFGTFVLLAASAVVGGILQTIGSIIEPILHFLIGGTPSDRALKGKLGNRYLSAHAASHIKELLVRKFSRKTDRDLFQCAMILAEAKSDSRARTFNAQYAHQRSTVVLSAALVAVLVVSRLQGKACVWSQTSFWLTLVSILALFGLSMWRLRQRGAYYVREVLLSAERLLDGEAPHFDNPN